MKVHGYRAGQPLSYGKIERAAEHVRSIIAAGVAVNEPLPGIALFESLDQHWVSLGRKNIAISYAVEDLQRGVEAQARYDTDRKEIEICLSRPTYEALEREYPASRYARAKFSLYHEIGHTVLHTDKLVELSTMPHHRAALLRGEKRNHEVFMDTEWQANAFAAALQVPAHGLRLLEEEIGELSPELIMQRFRISRAAADVRLKLFLERRAQLLGRRG